MNVRAAWLKHIDSDRYGSITSAARYQGARHELLLYHQGIVRATKKALEAHYGWRLSRLDFYFLNKHEPNAVLVQSVDRHAIGICVGLPFAMVRYLRKAAKDREFLKQYLVP